VSLQFNEAVAAEAGVALLASATLPWPLGISGEASIAIAVVGLVLVGFGMRRHRPSGAVWPLLAAALAVNAVATAILHAPAVLGATGQTVYSSSWLDVGWVVTNLLLAAALLCALAARERLLAVVLDVATMAAAVGLVVGLALVGPDVGTLSSMDAAVGAARAGSDIVLISILVRLALTPSGPSPALWLLAVATVALVTSDLLWNWLTLSGTYTVGRWADVGWNLFPLLVGVAALHPSMGAAAPPRVRRDDLRRTTPVVLGATTLVAPMLLGLGVVLPGLPDIDSAPGGGIVLLVTGTAISALVVTRFMLLLGRARNLAEAAVSQRDEAGRKLELSEAGHRALLEQLPAVVIVYRTGVPGESLVTPIYVGGQTDAILGVPAEDVLLRTDGVLARVHPEDHPGLEDRLTRPDEGPTPVEFRFTRPDDTEIWLRHLRGTSDPLEGGGRLVQGLLFDVTSAKRAEAERQRRDGEQRQSQKLQAVGQLAAGIAHEINTPVQFVGDTVHFLQSAFADVMELVQVQAEVARAAEAGAVDAELLRRVAEAEELADVAYLTERVPAAFARAEDGVQRVATIVRAMREFAHPSSADRGPVDLNQAVTNTLIVAGNACKYVADVETDLGPLPAVVCDGGDINQVLLNLVLNAAHAIESEVGDSGERGTIRIRTSCDATHALISVSDTGCGIPPDVAVRIFDPFFTTKEVGRGTGQGLAIARTMVVERHGGTLSFDTEPGRGTTFHVRLPLSAAERPDRLAVAA
jgi:signal transduction histidine kinase